MNSSVFILICLFFCTAFCSQIAVHVLLDPLDSRSAAYVRNEVSKVANDDLSQYVNLFLIPYGQATFDLDTEKLIAPGGEPEEKIMAWETCVSENANLPQAVIFFNCIDEHTSANDFEDLDKKCIEAAKIPEDKMSDCFANIPEAHKGLYSMRKKSVYEETIPYFPYVLIEGHPCEGYCTDLYKQICDYYPTDIKPYVCRIPVSQPIDVFDNSGEITAHYENPEEDPNYKYLEKVSRNVDRINVKVMWNPTIDTQKEFLGILEDVLYKDYRNMVDVSFYPLGSIPYTAEGEEEPIDRCGNDKDCQYTKHMLCGKQANTDSISYWGYLMCMTRHGEYMLRNVDYCASSSHLHAPYIHECIEGEQGNELVNELITLRNTEFKDIKNEEIPAVMINNDKCINNCGDMYPRICSKIGGKTPVYCGGEQRVKPALAPCKACHRNEELRPPGEYEAETIELYMDAGCKWCNKYLSGPMTWLFNHKRFYNSVDLHIHAGMGCYINKRGLPICPKGAHQTTQNIILMCARDLYPDWKVHLPLQFCFAKYNDEYEKHIDECSDLTNTDPQELVNCVNEGRGVEAFNRYFRRTRRIFDPISLPSLKLKNETVYEYNKGIEKLCAELKPIPKFCKKLPKFPKKSPFCKADDLESWN
ncbi:hypothetical protein WA158_008409 [Blastocystis sp. Blastoise]